MWSADNGEGHSSQSDCNDFWKPCVFYNDDNRVASATPGRVLVGVASRCGFMFYSSLLRCGTLLLEIKCFIVKGYQTIHRNRFFALISIEITRD